MNTHALNGNAGMIPTNRLLGAYWAEARYEFMRMLRNLAFGGPILLIPLGAYLLVGVAISGEATAKDSALADLLFSGFSVLAVTMPALFSVGCILALEREAGLMKLKRAQPAPAGSWLIAKMLVAVAFGVMAYLPLLAVGVLWGNITMDAGELVAMSAVLIAGAIPFAAIGLFIGSLVSASAAPGYANLFYLPCIYLSGLFIPLPKSMHAQTVIWPAFHLDQLAMAAGGVEKYRFMPPLMAAAVLVGITVVFGGLAIWRLARKG
jgi:ABC-2 type transport system permease protein